VCCGRISNGAPVGLCHAPSGGWGHLFLGHRDLPEEKCHPVVENRTGDGSAATDA